MYYSEYEYPVTFFKVEAAGETQLPHYIASRKNTDIGYLKSISPEHFFARFENYLSFRGPDELLNENARRFIALKDFLEHHFKKIFVFRIERPGDAEIPIVIVVQAEDGSFGGLETIAIET